MIANIEGEPGVILSNKPDNATARESLSIAERVIRSRELYDDVNHRPLDVGESTLIVDSLDRVGHHMRLEAQAATRVSRSVGELVESDVFTSSELRQVAKLSKKSQGPNGFGPGSEIRVSDSVFHVLLRYTLATLANDLHMDGVNGQVNAHRVEYSILESRRHFGL